MRAAVCAVVALALVPRGFAASTVVSASCRDRFLWPFSVGSIWNMPIGDGAQFSPSGVFQPGLPLPLSFHSDQDLVVRAGPNDPLVDWIDQGDWNADPKCVVTGKVAMQIPLPDNFTTGCIENNNSMGLLMPDNVSLLQMQPAYRENGTSPFLARYQRGAPNPTPFNISILSDGALGAHGGSGLSSIGGTIRSGELNPDAPPISHALKLELYAHFYYYGGSEAPCYTWPAIGCDSYAHSPGIGYNGTNVYVKPGALLAVPSAVAGKVSVTTLFGKKILAALVTYGGYLADDTASNNFAICMEPVVADEIQANYGVSVSIQDPLQPSTPEFADLIQIFQSLQVVTNNANSTVGGGGTPIGPLAPPICDE